MRRYILSAIVLIVFPLAACSHWTPIEVPPPGNGWDGEPWKVRVTTVDSLTWLLSDFSVRGDTLEGGGYLFESAEDRQNRAARSVVIAVSEVQILEQLEEKPLLEIGLTVGAILGAMFLAVEIID